MNKLFKNFIRRRFLHKPKYIYLPGTSGNYIYFNETNTDNSLKNNFTVVDDFGIIKFDNNK